MFLHSHFFKHNLKREKICLPLFRLRYELIVVYFNFTILSFFYSEQDKIREHEGGDWQQAR